jgi:phage tail-like protein
MSIDERSSLLSYLPAIFQEGIKPDEPNFLSRFLLAFERLLLGLGKPDGFKEVPQPGLEELLAGIVDPASGKARLAGIARYFEPGAELQDHERAPREFLQWLAGWVALTLREDWDELRQRDLIAKAAQLYHWRGAKRGIEEFLRIYTRLGVRIDEMNTPFQIEVHSTLDKDTILDGGAPFFFHVHVLAPTAGPEARKQLQEIAAAIVDVQKPAHTGYKLFIKTKIMQIEDYSTVGVDTFLGAEGEDNEE